MTSNELEREVERQLDVMRHGAVDFLGEEELRERLAQALRARRPLRVKLGMDPSSPDLHLGHTVVLQKLKRIQELAPGRRPAEEPEPSADGLWVRTLRAELVQSHEWPTPARQHSGPVCSSRVFRPWRTSARVLLKPLGCRYMRGWATRLVSFPRQPVVGARGLLESCPTFPAERRNGQKRCFVLRRIHWLRIESASLRAEHEPT